MTSPNANEIEANANNANANNNANSVTASGRRENTINRSRVPPLLVINETNLEDDALPTGFAPFEIQTFINFVDRINPVLLPIYLNNNES